MISFQFCLTLWSKMMAVIFNFHCDHHQESRLLIHHRQVVAVVAILARQVVCSSNLDHVCSPLIHVGYVVAATLLYGPFFLCSLAYTISIHNIRLFHFEFSNNFALSACSRYSRFFPFCILFILVLSENVLLPSSDTGRHGHRFSQKEVTYS